MPSPAEPSITVPARLARRLGAEYAAWLTRLPALAEEHLARWSLTDARPVQPGGRRSLVVVARTRDGVDVALKLSPERSAAYAEAEALRLWGGHGAVALLASAADQGALLLERLRPEVSLRSLPETRAALEATEVLRRLWLRPPDGHGFEDLARSTRRAADRMRGELPETAPVAEPGTAADGPPHGAGARDSVGGAPSGTVDLVRAALSAREDLLADPPEAELLHGALRQGCVLAGPRQPWTAIGPRPVVGERAFDLASLVLDRLDTLLAEPSAPAAVRRRLHGLADALEVDRARLRAWTHFRAVAEALRALDGGERQRGELHLELAAHL